MPGEFRAQYENGVMVRCVLSEIIAQRPENGSGPSDSEIAVRWIRKLSILTASTYSYRSIYLVGTYGDAEAAKRKFAISSDMQRSLNQSMYQEAP
jgi:hypothetical protein